MIPSLLVILMWDKIIYSESLITPNWQAIRAMKEA